MTLDETARAAAVRLVERFGMAVTIRRTASAYDPATGKTTDTTRDFTVKVSPPERFREGLIDGELVRAGDLRVSMAAEGAPIVPEPITDAAIINGEIWTLLRVDPLFGGQQAALYTLHLRK